MGFTYKQRRALLITSAIAVTLILIYVGWTAYLHNPDRNLPYHDSFAAANSDEWQAFGGNWQISDGGMRNDSDERGSKLMAGSAYWKNYILSADVQLLGEDGDAGLMLRSNDEEQGVDSYRGYYVGLRTRDNRLVIGRADHDWKEEVSTEVPRGVNAFRWYHLRIVAYECQIVAMATDPTDPRKVTTVVLEDRDCDRSGRIGLRSYTSGGAWKDVSVQLATYADLQSALSDVPAEPRRDAPAASPPDMPHFGSGSRPSRISPQHQALAGLIQSVSSLKLAAPGTSATIRGVITLITPAVYVQDSSGGVAVEGSAIPSLKIGDEVQVTGKVQADSLTSRLVDSYIKVLWPRAPLTPASITPDQAAGDTFNATFVELEGSLRGITHGQSNTIELAMESDKHPFLAIVNVGRGDLVLRRMERNSFIRLRGICVVDPAYTQHRLPFVLLVRSADDIEVIAGPPWWNTRHIVAISFCILILMMLGFFVYSRMERWRWRTILLEREHLAHEMHDTLAQSFAGLGFQLEAIRDNVPEDIATVHEQLDMARDLVRRSHQEARRSIATLRQSHPEHIVDLLSALEHCAHKMVENCGVVVDAVQDGLIRPLPSVVSDALFRIGQEALANSVRHARPTGIKVILHYYAEVIEMRVEDNGTGFTPGYESAGFGLQGIRRRAEGISAIAQIMSAPDSGTQVVITAPLPPLRTWLGWPKHAWQTILRYWSYAKTREQTHSRSYRR